MATFLDIGLAQHFSVIFPVLLVFVLVFAILEKTQIFGDKKGLHSIIALCLAVMMLFIPGVVQVVSMMAPWVVVLLLFIVFLMVLFMAMGVKWDQVVKYASGEFEVAHWFLLILMIIIFIGSIGSVYGNSMLPFSGGKVAAGNITQMNEDGTYSTDTGEFNQNVGSVIFHPKVLGLLFVLMVGALAIKLLSGKMKV